MIAALRDLAMQIPVLKRNIQDGLLKMLSMVLMGRPLRHPGAPKYSQTTLPTSGKRIAHACYTEYTFTQKHISVHVSFKFALHIHVLLLQHQLLVCQRWQMLQI